MSGPKSKSKAITDESTSGQSRQIRRCTDDGSQVFEVLSVMRGAMYLSGAAIDAAASLALVPDEHGIARVPVVCQSNRAKRDGEHYHITLLSKDELRRVLASMPSSSANKSSAVSSLLDSMVEWLIDDWVDLGLGKVIDSTTNDKAFFKVLRWPGGAAVRERLHLPPCDFHITVGFHPHDVHTLRKNEDTLMMIEPIDENDDDETAGTIGTDAMIEIDMAALKKRVAACRSPDDFTRVLSTELRTQVLEASSIPVSDRVVLYGLAAYSNEKLGDIERAIDNAERAIALGPSNSIGYLRKAMALMHAKRFADAIVVLESGLQHAAAVATDRANLEKALARCREKLPSSSSAAAAPSTLMVTIPALEPDDSPTTTTTSSSAATTEVALYNFSWIVPGQLAGMREPESREQIAALNALGVGLTVACAEHALRTALVRNAAFLPVFLRCENFRAPADMISTERLVRRAQDVISHGKAVVAHCPEGSGRTSIFLACYLIRNGLEARPNGTEAAQPVHDPDAAVKMSATRVIEYLQSVRPGSIEGEEQEQYVHKYEAYVRRRTLAAARKAAEAAATRSNTTPEVDAKQRKAAAKSAPKFVMLVGLPGSGKSTFSSRLEVSDAGGWIRISQDEIGSRNECEDALCKAAKKPSNRIVLDRCNVDAEDRKYWLDVAMRPKDAVAVFFDVPAEVCIERVSGRADHPTIAQGKGAGIVRSFAKKLTAPTRAEGFTNVYTVSSIGDANALLRRWGALEIALDDEDDDDEEEELE